MTTLQHLRLGSLGLAAVLAVTLAWGLMRRDPMSPGGSRGLGLPLNPVAAINPERLERERVLVRTRMNESQDYSGFARKYAAAFPADWLGLIDRLAQRRVMGDATDSPDAWFVDALRDLRRARGVTAAKASPPALSRILETQGAALSALSVLDQRLCVDFLFGQPSQAFLDFAARHPGLIAQMANAALDAIIDGRASNVTREPPTNADLDLLEAALQKNGLSPAEIEAMLDGRHPEPPLPDERLCAIGITYLDTLKRLPEAPRLRLYALSVELMARM